MDNLDAAMVNEVDSVTRSSNTGTEAGEQAKQVLIRASEASRERWKEAAARQGTSMSEFVREAADRAASEALDCTHGNLRIYPWRHICMDCGATTWQK